ncbi:class I mannose-6-phosphate isomerase [Croceicoccus naphthovorans]|uniref:Mannose-6-phosphate isomerase n=1 Tax=Croceicoccus naphthovorans TaxID=1348774 RepID=A0A0G3XEF6_9SPHN|nr:class I mannose-6-phosphate isomerase [Croceicoccus naphthovorans]AKM09542.1 mannose-6-phosphate isomerase [Croceicoccus naphthovorans]MBB3989705.1 mannose-6-phosphate isomerase [Croceicoccus naphthovorans]
MILPTISVEKPWGKDTLPAPFTAPDGKRIGEIWFEPPEALPELLCKYIFTSEKLSVQVHPDDDQAEAAGQGRQGKSECWYVIDADEGATLGVGFAEDIDADAMRAAAIDGSIEDKLVWHPVKAGDFFYIPANTVHAIGAGVSLIEVQQNSDITYRLYDYGRPRELHLDAGIAVARGAPYNMELFRHVPDHGTQRLVNGPFFVLDRVHGPIPEMNARDYPAALLVIPRTPGTTLGGKPVAVGECALAQSIGDVEVAEGALCLLTRPR